MRDLIKRYLKITVCIVCILIVMNAVLIEVWLGHADNETPIEVSHFMDGITISEHNCSVSKESRRFIEDNSEWTIVLNDSGEIIFSYNLPDELNRDYSIGEIADYAKWYIDGYPVKMLNAPNGLVIMGNDKGSSWKKNVSVTMNNGIVIIIVVVLLNVLAAVILSYVLARLFMRDLGYVIEGIFDVSEDKKVELSEKGYLKEISKAVNRVSAKISKQKQIIANNNEMKKEWLAGVSHDIRTPLSVIVGNAEELQKLETNQEKIHQLEVIRKQSFKIKYLVNDLNLISRLDNENIEIRVQNSDIYKLLRECIADMMNIYGQQKYEFMLDNQTDSEKVYVQADGHLLKRAFDNILLNSIVHNNEGCGISVTVRNSDSGLSILFADDGVGVSDEKIIELNGVGKQDINRTHGWGTIVVKKIIELHNGEVEFKKSEEGMKVCVTLPLEKLG